MRRVWGILDRTTVEMSNLLSCLYTTEKRYLEALAVHEEILRHEIDSEEEEITKDDAVTTRKQLELLRRTYQRNGGWGDKDPKVYHELYQQLSQVFGHETEWQGVKPMEKWNINAATDNEGTFTTPTSWEFMDASEEKLKRRNLLRLTSAQWLKNHHGNRNVEARESLVGTPKPEAKKAGVYQNGNGGAYQNENAVKA